MPNPRAREDDPLLSEARERLNLLFVSYLSAPHYSALPLQDQECIDRETVNAFLLDERFQRYSRRGSLVGINHSASTHPTRNAESFKEGHSEERESKVVLSRPAQLVLLGLCSIALLTPTLASTTSNATASASPSFLSEFLTSLLPNSVTSWPAWTNGLVRTAPGVFAVTGLAAFFATSGATFSPSASLATSASRAGNAGPSSNEQDDRDAIIQELRQLFNACKQFIDECTRLDITLEKGFTVIADLDRLVDADEDKYEEDSVKEAEEGDVGDVSFESHLNGPENLNWQDLTTMEARLSTSHPGQCHASGLERKRRKKRLPALDVRRTIFSSLYNIQERLEKELDTLSVSPEAGKYGREEDIDSLELERLLDMYNCRLYTVKNHGKAGDQDFQNQDEEKAAEQLYRRTMARRSLSPSLYNEQQQQAGSFPVAAKLKRRSGLYDPSSIANHGDVSFVLRPAVKLAQEEQVNRRASWAAFQPSPRRHINPVVHQGKMAPHSPASISQNRPRNTAIATPPRPRPQSIHFGGVLPVSNQTINVESSPLASGARESNSTIKRERRRRSEQNFPLSGMQHSSQIADDEALSQLRSSTSSNVSEDYSMGSSAAMRMSVSSQGTSADPITAASVPPELFESPSRPAHARRTSLGQLATTSRTSLHQQNRRTRPLSMHELDYGKLLHRSSFSQLDTSKAQLDEVPEAESTASHRSAAAAALERRVSSHARNPPNTALSTSSSFASSLLSHPTRSRPGSLLLQSSPIMPSAYTGPSFAEVGSPAASFRSRRSHYQDHKRLPMTSKFALESLRDSSQRISILEKALICHILALKYSNWPVSKLRKTLQLLSELVIGINTTINTETLSVSQAMWEEFEGLPAQNNVVSTSSGPISASILLATPMTSHAYQSTPRRSSFIACLPGSYPSSPLIEVAPATPPFNNPEQSANSPFFPRLAEDERQPTNFAPRAPFSPSEQSGRDALMESHVRLNSTLRSIASKLYMERQELKAYFIDPRDNDQVTAAEQSELDQMETRHASLKADLQALLRSWEEGRVAIRQMKEGRQHRVKGFSAGPDCKGRTSSEDASQCEVTEEELSLLSTSAELEKYGSVSSVLSSSNEDSLTTPAHSPITQASYQPPNIVGMLLDDETPHMPRYGLQEQLYEAYVGDEEVASKLERTEGKLSRAERIALARSKRLEKNEGNTISIEPQASAELINELKDMVALLRCGVCSCQCYEGCALTLHYMYRSRNTSTLSE